MAATHPRRKKSEMRLESATCDPTIFLDTLINADLPIKTVIYKILSQKGPFSAPQLIKLCHERGKLNATESGVRKALVDLKALGLVVRINGGYAIHNWDQIGRTA